MDGQIVPTDIGRLIMEFLEDAPPDTIELRDGFLTMNPAQRDIMSYSISRSRRHHGMMRMHRGSPHYLGRSLSTTLRYINYSIANWLEPMERDDREWACIRLVRSPDDPYTYIALRYCRQCSNHCPEGQFADPDRELARRTDPSFFRLRYEPAKPDAKDQSGRWTYKGRGVMIDFPVESKEFFPQDQTQYEYMQSQRTITGKIVHGPFTWSSNALTSLEELMQKRREYACETPRGTAEQRYNIIHIINAMIAQSRGPAGPLSTVITSPTQDHIA